MLWCKWCDVVVRQLVLWCKWCGVVAAVIGVQHVVVLRVNSFEDSAGFAAMLNENFRHFLLPSVQCRYTSLKDDSRTLPPPARSLYKEVNILFVSLTEKYIRNNLWVCGNVASVFLNLRMMNTIL